MLVRGSIFAISMLIGGFIVLFVQYFASTVVTEVDAIAWLCASDSARVEAFCRTQWQILDAIRKAILASFCNSAASALIGLVGFVAGHCQMH